MKNGQGKLTLYFITQDWSGLHDMFETESSEAIAGVPLVPMYWFRLAERGHRVHVFVVGSFQSESNFVLKGVNFYRLCIPKWTTSGVGERRYMGYIKIGFFLYTIKAVRAVRDVAQSEPPDVIYSYSPGNVVASLLLSRRFLVPHVVHFWGTWLGHYLFNEPWYKRLWVLGKIMSLKFPLDLLIISNDGTQGDKVVERLKFPKERFRFWLDGVAPNIYQPDLDIAAIKRSVGLGAADLMILQVARLDVWKRIDRGIGAMPAVLQRVPHARLVVAGDGHLRESLEKQAEKLGVRACVRFLGSVPHQKVLELHNATDLFLTVQDLTNLGNQLLEAMHSGTCIVAYDVGGTRDVMVDGLTGVLVTDDDLPRLGEIIADLLLDEKRCNLLAKGALKYANENIWNWDERIEVEIREIQELVAKHRCQKQRNQC